ncbi:MAG: tail fiber domain-containing protein [Lysobacterales bacterium]
MFPSAQRALVATIVLLGSDPILAASFVYEGRLNDYGQPANGQYDLRIGAFSDRHLGAAVLAPTTFFDVPVVDGQFRLEVELPLANTDAVWIEAAVRQQGAADFNPIPGRSKAVSGTIGQCWSTTGDAGSTGANRLGTLDARPLRLVTDNAESLVLTPSEILFNFSPITANLRAGSRANQIIGARGATISGGGMPDSGDSDPDFANDGPNRAFGHYSTISGGYGNGTGFLASFRLGDLATVGGGARNFANGLGSTVIGGSSNVATGFSSAVLGGESNAADGHESVVSGGFRNCAGGDGSWAGGTRAQVRKDNAGTSNDGAGCLDVAFTGDSDGDEGTFVWADLSSGSAFTSTGPNQFLIRSSNGLGLNTNIPTPSHLTIGKNDGSSNTLALGYQGDVTRWRIGGPDAGSGAAFEVQTGGDQVLLRAEDAGSSARVGIARDPETNALEVEGNASKTTSGSWLANSDARIKTEVREIDDALERLLRLRPVTFRYTPAYRAAHPGIADQTYYNVIAQEFAQVFPEAVQGSGEYLPQAERTADNVVLQVDVHPALITTIAAVQELALRLEAERKLLDAQLWQLTSDNAALREAAARNESRLARLEAMLALGGR